MILKQNLSTYFKLAMPIYIDLETPETDPQSVPVQEPDDNFASKWILYSIIIFAIGAVFSLYFCTLPYPDDDNERSRVRGSFDWSAGNKSQGNKYTVCA